MTPNEFRKLALSFPQTEERVHMHHPDFRVAGKIFATMGYPDKTRAMVKVTPVEQGMLVQAEPGVFSPVTGAWGRKGCTSVLLKAAKKESLRRALAAAWELNAPGGLRKQLDKGATVAGKLSAKKEAAAARSPRRGNGPRKAVR
jgi:hypothetical protein